MDEQKWQELSLKVGRACAIGLTGCAMILALAITLKISIWILML